MYIYYVYLLSADLAEMFLYVEYSFETYYSEHFR